jgi:hypothetical protein
VFLGIGKNTFQQYKKFCIKPAVFVKTNVTDLIALRRAMAQAAVRARILEKTAEPIKIHVSIFSTDQFQLQSN